MLSFQEAEPEAGIRGHEGGGALQDRTMRESEGGLMGKGMRKDGSQVQSGLRSGTNKRVTLAFVSLRVTTGCGQGAEKYSLCRRRFSETSKAVSL